MTVRSVESFIFLVFQGLRRDLFLKQLAEILDSPEFGALPATIQADCHKLKAQSHGPKTIPDGFQTAGEEVGQS